MVARHKSVTKIFVDEALSQGKIRDDIVDEHSLLLLLSFRPIVVCGTVVANLFTLHELFTRRRTRTCHLHPMSRLLLDITSPGSLAGSFTTPLSTNYSQTMNGSAISNQKGNRMVGSPDAVDEFLSFLCGKSGIEINTSFIHVSVKYVESRFGNLEKLESRI